jgi:hypothetical protein
MPHYEYDNSPYPIRSGLSAAYQNYWQALASPGTWFTGTERVAIAAEVRTALSCPFCAERKAALSPYAVTGEHSCDALLDARIVDAVHRVITDQSRITQAFIDDNSANGLSEEHYVELVGVAVTVLSIDEFNRAGAGRARYRLCRHDSCRWRHGQGSGFVEEQDGKCIAGADTGTERRARMDGGCQ